jgi:hypothetical protein
MVPDSGQNGIFLDFLVWKPDVQTQASTRPGGLREALTIRKEHVDTDRVLKETTTNLNLVKRSLSKWDNCKGKIIYKILIYKNNYHLKEKTRQNS